MNLIRIKLKDVIDDRFCIIWDKHRYRNRDYRSMRLVPYLSKPTVLNLLEVRTRSVIDRLAFRFSPENVSRPAMSLVEEHMGEISFPWADVSPKATTLLLSSAKTGLSPARLARWISANCSEDVLIVEGSHRSRISFASPEDYLLTRLRFS